MHLSLLFNKRTSPNLKLGSAPLHYDAERQINIIETAEGVVPAIAHPDFAATQSKTLHRLGDDDPDPDHQRLY